MEGKASRKISGGKLVRVEVEFGEKINKVIITGDFFLHPEESLQEIEQSIEGASINASTDELVQRIKRAIHLRNAELIGFDPEDIAELVKEAMQ